jgi:Helix-turn-helix domain
MRTVTLSASPHTEEGAVPQTPRELTPHASLRHFFGAELRHWRQLADLSHDRLGAQINYSGAAIGKVEKAERAPTAALAEACDQVLGTGGALARLVALIEATAQETRAGRHAGAGSDPGLVLGCALNGHGPTVAVWAERGGEPVNRFEFLVSTFGAGAGALVGQKSTEASRLGREDVTAWERNLSQLYELGDQYGGGVYELALRSLRRLRRVLQQDSYGPSTGEALHILAGELTIHAGWLAFDAGQEAEARYWWLEAAHTARLIEDDRLFVATLQLMSRQAGELGRAREAVELAQAGQLAAKPWGTPRLQSLLLVREGLGHARAGDGRATWQAFHQAGTLLGAGRRDEDPPWLAFWDEADLACSEMRAALHLGERAIAQRSSRTALATVRPEYRRNRAGYLAGRAEVLVGQRNIEEAVSTAAQAVVAASEISSSRINARIGRVRGELARYSDQPTVAEFLDWSAEILPTKANTSADPRRL